MKVMKINRTGAAAGWGALPSIGPDQAFVQRTDYQGSRSGASQRFTRPVPGYVPFSWMTTGACGCGGACGPCASAGRSTMRIRTRGDLDQIDIPRMVTQGVEEAQVREPRSLMEIGLVAAGIYFALNLLGG